MDAKKHCLYVVECADGSLYTGYTTDVQARIRAHNQGKGAKYTRSRGPVRLRAHATFDRKETALSAEYRFKRLARARKLELIAQAEGGKPFEDVLAAALGLPAPDGAGRP